MKVAIAATKPPPKLVANFSTTLKRKKLRQGAVGVRKVKMGCLTCKMRHKKCDEKAPACTPCSSTGRRCDFISADTTITKLSASTSTHSTYKQQEIIPQMHHSLLQPILAFPLQQKDEMHFEYFRYVGIREFGLYFSKENGGGGDGFWEQTLFQAVQREPFVLHAALALAAFGKERYHPSQQTLVDSKGLDLYPVLEYNTSIRLLNERIDQCVDGNSLELAILGTHLFVAMEVFWTRIPRVEGLLDGMCKVLRGCESTKRYFPEKDVVGWEDFRCEGDGGLERLLKGLAEIARQIACFRSFEGVKQREGEVEEVM